MRGIIMAGIALAMALPAAAQPPPPDPQPTLPPRRRRRRAFQDVLEMVPSVWIRPRAGAADESQLSIRGSGLRNNFHLRGVNVLLDGFPYGNADGFSDFESLELLDTKRIEVSKGANALRFGGNTLGGALNLVTKTGHAAGLLEARSEAGSFGFFKNHLATGQVYGPLDFYLGLTAVDLDGYREHADQVRRRVYSSSGYRLPGGTTVRLDLNYVRSEENLPVRLDTGETCVYCRVDVAAGPGERVSVLWRKVFADSVRDMVLASSRDGGRTFAPPAQVHADGWKIAACPHRGGSVATDARGRLYTVWYTEGTEGRPDLLFATSADGRRFSTPRRLHTAPGSIPDQARLAVDASGRGVVVWEDLTAVRRRVVMRTTLDGGRTLSPPQTLTEAVKAFAPDVVTAPGGFLIVWHEEQFPSIKTVLHSLKLQETR